MTPVTVFVGRRVALFGLGGSGLATARALRAGGADVAAWDDNQGSRDKAAAEGIAVVDLNAADWTGFAAFVLSPGVPLTHPEPHWTVGKAKAAGVAIIGDVELFFRERAKVAPGSPVVCITGTNGKSTTTALIGHILRSAGIERDIGGNFGPAALDFRPLDRDGVYVLELSSFQLELVQSLRCSVAVWLNITPDHIDRHGDLAGYVVAKRHVFDNQQEGDVAVVGIDDEPSRQAAAGLAGGPGTLVTVTVGGADGAGVSAQGGRLRDARTGAEIDLKPIKNLPGAHNWQNAACAYAACRALGLPVAAIAQGLATYPGLAHRQERVAVVDGIVYINDSKATNADATEKALAAYDTIYWLVGGTPKAEGIAPLEPLFGRVAHAFLIGISSDAFAATLEGKVPYTRSGDLKTALQQAHAMAQRERRQDAVVLLSPACASYDQWPNFEVRGDAFRTLARALPGATVETGGAA